jgi:hypothetical protein
MTGRSCLALALAAQVATSFAIVTADAQAQPLDDTAIEEKFGAMMRRTRWTSPSITVCWENPSDADAKQRELVQRAVRETWALYSPIEVKVPWPRCGPSTKGVRIKIGDEGARCEALGKYLDGRPNGMVLNFSFSKWGSNCQSNPDLCIYAIAAHEFGHALGFTHEDNRSDTPEECKRDFHQGVDGDYYVTKYDPESIMNYCTKPYLGNGKLSKLDVETVTLVYGKPAP